MADFDPLLEEFMLAAINDPAQACDLFARHPELLNLRTGLGETALHYLAVENCAEAVRLLVKLGFDPNATNEFGACAIDEAITVEAFEAAEVLRQAGARRGNGTD